MKLRDYITTVLPRAASYELARRGVAPAPRPLTLTFSVTAACQSRCLTCNIGNVYLDNPALARQNLSLAEIEQVFRSMGRTYFFNISGGEPFMRGDIAEIVRLACLHLRPSLIHIPTNALAPRYIERAAREMLAHMDALLPAAVPLTIKPSVDGIGAEHDRVRGAPGNFRKLEQTIDLLLALRRENPRLHVDLGTVISNFNLEHLDAIEDWVHARGVESYRHEIAEQRAEFHNIGDPITPAPAVYRRLTERFAAKIRENIASKAPLTRMTEAVRLVYYQVACEILEQRRQVTPCYGGLSNIHMNFDGEIWPCCVLGGEQALGRAREWGYNIPALLRSAQSRRARAYIAAGNCACPLANQWLSNMLLTPRHMLSVARNYLELELSARRYRRGRGEVLGERPHRGQEDENETRWQTPARN
ncbi:MAG: radical SAM protein [Myxococcales bacterium]|nr:radical SAM protein [Myxococcales bacterium]